MYRSTHNHATKFAPTATTQTGNAVIPHVPNPYGGHIGPEGVPNLPAMIPLLGGSNGSPGIAHNELPSLLLGTGTDNKGHQADEHRYSLQHDFFSNNCDGQQSEFNSFNGDDNTPLCFDLGLGVDMVSKFLLSCCFSSHGVHPILCRF
jgi:hypothetical protein